MRIPRCSPVWIINFYGKLFLTEVQVFQLLPLVQLVVKTRKTIPNERKAYVLFTL